MSSRKRIRFSRETLSCKIFVTDVITEDPHPSGNYYFFDENGWYTTIKKSYENKKYTITSLFSKKMEEKDEKPAVNIFGSNHPSWI